MLISRVYRMNLNSHLKVRDYGKWLKVISFCLDNPADQKLVLGWGGIYKQYQIDDYASFAEAARDNDRKQCKRASRALTYFGELKKDDLVWTRDAEDNWWLCRVLAPAESFCRPDLDIGAAVGVEAYCAGHVDISKFCKMFFNETMSKLEELDFVAFSRYMFNLLARRREYRGMRGTGNGAPSIFSPYEKKELPKRKADMNVKFYPKSKAVMPEGGVTEDLRFHFSYRVEGESNDLTVADCMRMNEYIEKALFIGFEADKTGMLVEIPVILSEDSGTNHIDDQNRELGKILERLRNKAKEGNRYSDRLNDLTDCIERELSTATTDGLHDRVRQTIDECLGNILRGIGAEWFEREYGENSAWIYQVNNILIEFLNITRAMTGVLGLFRHSGNSPEGIVLYIKDIKKAAIKSGIDYGEYLMTVLCHEMYHFRHFMAVLAKHGHWEPDENIIYGGYVSEALAKYSELYYTDDNNYVDIFDSEYNAQKTAGNNGGYSAGVKIYDNGEHHKFLAMSMDNMDRANEEIYNMC